MSNVIMIEGCDGCGKATISGELNRIIQSLDMNSTVVHFPDYDSPTGKMVSQMLSGELFGDPVYADPNQCSMLYVMDRLNYYAQHPDIFGINDFVIMDRSWLSNVFFQGCKIYFRRLLNALKDILRDPSSVVVIVDGHDDVLSYMDAAHKDKDVDFSLKYYFILRNANYGLYQWNESKHNFCAVVAYAHSKQNDEISEVKKYIKTQFTMEIDGTPLKNHVIDSFYIGFGSAKDTATNIKIQMHNRDQLDGHEKNMIYLELVDAFAEILIRENWLPEGVRIQYIQTRHSSSQADILNIARAISTQILSVLAIRHMRPELISLPTNLGV